MIIQESIWTSEGVLMPADAVEITAAKTELETASKGKIYISPLAVELIKHFESAHDGNPSKAGLQPKMDPIGIWTVGYGRALRDKNGRFLRGEKDRAEAAAHPLSNLSIEEATALLKEDLETLYMPLVHKLVRPWRFNDDQLGALCSFAYNCGTHYRNRKGQRIPYRIWDNAMTLKGEALKNYWENSVIRGGGRVLPGLIRRRKAEYHLFSTGKLKFTF